MKRGGKLPALLILSCSLYWTLAPVVAMAKVQVLPEASYAPSYDYHGLKESDVRRVLIRAKEASSVERE
ncbi:MAG: hypothetical protein JSS39_18865 [Nitrospira sp.]|nr:hypothetical protein [Nitrospira sp.]